MDAIAPSSAVIDALRAIARSGFAYQRTKEVAAAAGWRLEDDDADFGHVVFRAPMGTGDGKRGSRRLSVELSEGGRPVALVTLCNFEEDEGPRARFDDAFRSILEAPGTVLGPPSVSGQYEYPHRKGWPYAYAGWLGGSGDATFVLVQDELDIQFGMDVTLWVVPGGVPIEIPVSAAFER